MQKGSITVDGVSLTVRGHRRRDVHRGADPDDVAHTTLGARAAGDTVNLEVDVVAKYVERLVRGYDNAGSGATNGASSGR